jgi:cytoskeletal protein CcmA (bactofilin family)
VSIFRRQESRPPADEGAAAGAERTVIAAGSLVRGEISGLTELVVEGRVEGEVRVDAGVAIGPRGEVVGPVRGRSVRIAGRVVGRVEAEERVELLPEGSLEGDISAPRIVVGEGAFFKGVVEMHAPGHDGQDERRRDERGG